MPKISDFPCFVRGTLMQSKPEIPSKRRIAFVKEGGLGSGPFNSNQPAHTWALKLSKATQEILCQ